ncbi:hexokinase-domain-containing protein [Myxozyma melibiosi]|uniref:Phosphotransferase n=1 Tax=Myxozyma melibiosi TaxID=54550 RepID=A0ABR1F3J3_9ASCO
MTSQSLSEAVAEIVDKFSISEQRLKSISDEFIRLSKLGLHHEGESMSMIPSYVTSIPNGKEKGTFLAVDLGGTNFRVCSVHLNGDNTYDLLQTKTSIPRELMVGTSKDLFAFLAKRVEEFIKTHLSEKFDEDSVDHQLKLGFTFSFPVNQTAINRGTLLRWTKGFDIKDTVGQDVCKLLQDELDALNLKVHVAALVNDTVGTLMSRSYSSPGQHSTLMGIIIGTGTNCAYVESLDAVVKLGESELASLAKTSNMMIINTEWGSFDTARAVIGSTEYDDSVDQRTPNKGMHLFEKRISGMFLGELLRVVLTDLRSKNLLFSSSSPQLETEWILDTSALSRIEADFSQNLIATRTLISTDLGLETTLEERKAIKTIVSAIGKRSAYLAGAVVAGILELTSALDKSAGVDIGMDGSVIEFYPGYESLMREAVSAVVGQEKEARVHIGIAKDGSGVGAALCAVVA